MASNAHQLGWRTGVCEAKTPSKVSGQGAVTACDVTKSVRITVTKPMIIGSVELETGSVELETGSVELGT